MQQNKNRNLAYRTQYLRILLHRYACIAHFFLFPFPGTLKRKTGILYDRSRHYPFPSSDFNQKRFAMKQNTKENYLTHWCKPPWIFSSLLRWLFWSPLVCCSRFSARYNCGVCTHRQTERRRRRSSTDLAFLVAVRGAGSANFSIGRERGKRERELCD
jgi:hypothetical protein